MAKIKIRSTETRATSNSSGYCDIQRTLSNFMFDLVKNKFTTIVQDVLFQESETIKTVINEDGKEVEAKVIERKIIETRQPKAYVYDVDSIDGFYQLAGTEVTKKGGFTNGILKNLTAVLLVETSHAQRQTMSKWQVDSTDYVIVNQFTDNQVKAD